MMNLSLINSSNRYGATVAFMWSQISVHLMNEGPTFLFSPVSVSTNSRAAKCVTAFTSQSITAVLGCIH